MTTTAPADPVRPTSSPTDREPPPRNLFLFTDGTGNAGGKTRNTNVYRLFEAIHRSHPDVEQLTFYDDGVGSKDSRLSKAVGGAFGAGLSRNVLELYEWLVRHYRPGDRVFVLGFSRGAFTARSFAGMISRCGLLTRAAWYRMSVPERRRRLKRALWAYRASSDALFEKWRGDASDFTPVRIHFVGVWDTVDAVGVPIDELRPLFDVFFRIFAGRRAWGFHDAQLTGVEHARHALALDDERRTFHPNVWHRNPETKENAEAPPRSRLTDPSRIRQVWFAGAHSNVGGGYPKDQLALVALDWMMGELEALEEVDGTVVRLIPGSRETVQADADALGRHYDPRTGLAAYYRYSPRRVTRFYKGTDDFWVRVFRRPAPARLPGHGIELHSSVLRRVADGAQGYAPLVLPDGDDETFRLTAGFTNGGPFSADEDSPRIAERLTRASRRVRDKVHLLVVGRQLSYATFVAATVYTVFRGLVTTERDYDRTRAVLGGPTLGDLEALLKGLVPDLLGRLVDAALANPALAGLYLAVLAASGALSLRLKSRIARVAREVYDSAGIGATARGGVPEEKA